MFFIGSLFLMLWLSQGVFCEVGYKLTVPQKVKANRGSCLLIPCQFTSVRPVGSSPVGVWKVGSKTGTKVSSNNQSLDIWKNLNVYLVGDLKVKNCTTLLYGIQPNHAKKYYFREETITYNFDDFVEITIQDSLDLPVINTPAQMMEGTLVTLNCSAPAPCADENPSIQWDNLLNGTANQSETTRADGNKAMLSILTFTASFLHNKKTLTCTAQYTVGSVNKTTKRTTTLNVLYRPRNTSAVTNVHGVISAGTTVTLRCTSKANPPANYIWFKVDGPSDLLRGFGEELLLCKATQNDNGRYVCQAENQFGRENSTALSLEVMPKKENFNVTTIAVSISSGVLVVLMVLCLLVYLQKKRKMKMENGKETQSSEGTDVKKPETDTTSEDDGMALYSNNLVFNCVTNKRDNCKEVKKDNHLYDNRLTYADPQKRKTQTTADQGNMALYFNNCSINENLEEIQDYDEGFVDNVTYEFCEFPKGKSQSEDEELQYASVSFFKFKNGQQEDGEMAKDNSPDVTVYDVLPCKEAEHSPAPEDTCLYAEVKKKVSSSSSSATH
ncbi:myelin-associated glycoprotein-like isoform X2 [Erpetoichthys calabaricus]|uniref:myelin-associated glycoprotein-like isoform X2 n=1 Tax=Erpetoichthys calabaricus TaxID=27687 RepID=UPI002234A573|nr:myelin-associated glycoprotein-like isoform X2 [Erpetoichthys calabaricus]